MCKLFIVAIIINIIGAVFGAPGSVDYGLSLDFGNDWLKCCVVSRVADLLGSHVDVVLNEQSARRTAALVAYNNDGEYIMGDAAITLSTRTPHQVFPHIKRVIGVPFSTPMIGKYHFDFPNVQLTQSNHSSMAFRREKAHNISSEEVVVLLLQMMKKQALNHITSTTSHSASSINFVHLLMTVPVHYNDVQRAHLVTLASIADLKADTIDETTAVAIDYASRNLNDNASKVIAFFSVGSFGVSVSLVKLTKSPSSLTVDVLGTQSNPFGGGFTFDLIVRDQLAKLFDANRKNKNSKNSIRSNPRAMSKLLREARELKEMLSASPSIEIQVEELFENEDFKVTVTKEQFESWTSETIDFIVKPLQDLLKNMEDDSVGAIELFGGSVHIPALQAKISSLFPNITLGKHIDSQEAAMLGAAHYIGANLLNITKLFKVNVQQAPRKKPEGRQIDAFKEKDIQELKAIIKHNDLKVENKRLADTARNTLESLLNSVRDTLSDQKSKNSERAALQEALAAASTFLDDIDKNTTHTQYQQHIDAVNAALSAFVKTDTRKPKKPEKEVPGQKRKRASKHDIDRARKAQQKLKDEL